MHSTTFPYLLLASTAFVHGGIIPVGEGKTPGTFKPADPNSPDTTFPGGRSINGGCLVDVILSNPPDFPLDKSVFTNETTELSIAKNIDGPTKRDLDRRQESDPPPTEEPEAAGDGKTGTSRLRDYQALCSTMDRVYMVSSADAILAFMGDTILAAVAPSKVPKYPSGASAWVCDHILELNTIDDFFNQPNDPYAFIRKQLIDSTDVNCPLERMKRVLNADGNLFGVDRRVNGLKNVLLQAKAPVWPTWEDHTVAGTYLYLEEPTVQAKYNFTAGRAGRALDDFKDQATDTRNITQDFVDFARDRLYRGAMTAWNEWKGPTRGDAHVDNQFNMANLLDTAESMDVDSYYRPNNQNAVDINIDDFVEPEFDDA